MKIDLSVPELFNQGSFMVDRHLTEGRGAATALHYGDRKITYADLAANTNRAGNLLKGLGLEIENRVMVLLPDCPEFLYTYFGAMKIGAVPVPVNNLASAQDFAYFLNDSRAKAVVVSEELLPKLEIAAKETMFLRHILVVGKAAGGALSFDELSRSASDKLEAAATSRDDMAFWMYTSGTTGVPKGVVHLHHDVVYYQCPFAEQVLGITEKDTTFATSKMFFSYGRNGTLEIPLLYGASAVLYPQWPEPAKVFQVVEQERPTIFFSVPTFYAAMLREVDKTGRQPDFSSVRICLSSGEPLPRELFDRWAARFGIQIIDELGSTDVGAQYMSNLPGQIRPGSSGKVLDGFEGVLKDADGRPVTPGETGTLWLKSDGIAAGYWNKHQRSREVFVGEWLNTGDLFRQDADGYFWYEGRADDMLKVSGQWVSPIEIETILQQHPAVHECGVVGAPDDSGLIKIKAVVALNSGFQPSAELERELADLVHARAAHFKTPRWVKFATALPRTTTGKLQRHKLKQ